MDLGVLSQVHFKHGKESFMHRSKVTSRSKNEFFWGWMFVLPTVIGLLILNIIPIFTTIYQSFFKTGDFGKGNIFVGLANYQKLLNDPLILKAIGNTIKYTLIEVPFSIFIALILAAMLSGNRKGKSIYRTIFFLPMIAAPAAVAMVWRWLYNSDFGLINNIFGLRINWISQPGLATVSIAMIGIWSVLGYNIVLFIAGLQEIPKDYYEAARIDGASPIHQFFQITIPLLSPTLFFVAVTRVIGALQVFDLIYMVMDRTNPALNDTQSLVYLFYKYSFREGNLGYGSTVVMILLLLTMLVTVFQLWAQKKWVHYY